MMGIFKKPKMPKIDNKPRQPDPVDPVALSAAAERARAASGFTSLRINLNPGVSTGGGGAGVSIP